MHAIAESFPVFPCWLWQDGFYTASRKRGWIHFIEPVNNVVLSHCTHWHPDQPNRPEVQPD